jgi:hypothetical protein
MPPHPTLSPGDCVAIVGKGQAGSLGSFRIADLQRFLTIVVEGNSVFMRHNRLNSLVKRSRPAFAEAASRRQV